jgi:DNA-binding transcriptional MocR family regulator
VNLARLLRAIDVRAVTTEDGRAAGVLLGVAGTTDAIDATVVLLAAPGDRILTSDPGDLSHLAAAAGNRPVIVTCRATTSCPTDVVDDGPQPPQT